MSKPMPLVAGNWKMHGLRSSVGELARLAEGLAGISLQGRCEVMICPPATLLAQFADQSAGTLVRIGAQNCHAEISGAHTGELAAEMLADAGASAIIVGHSERRREQGETSGDVAAKAAAAHRAGLSAIVCVGETQGEREAGRTLAVVTEQLSRSLPDGARPANSIIAYEPVWAIGSGLTPGPGDIAEVHRAIRTLLTGRMGEEEGGSVRILYGGSVKPANASQLMAIANVDGALVGGASLKASDMLGIVAAYAR